METGFRHVVVTVTLGLFAAGALAALAIVAAPAAWRGPLIPAVAGLVGLGAVAFARRQTPPTRPERMGPRSER